MKFAHDIIRKPIISERSMEVIFDKENRNSTFSESQMSETLRESDIIHGAESYDTYLLLDDYRYEDLDTVIVTKEKYLKLEEGMNYEQVAELFGGPGKLYESHSNQSTYGTYSYTTYVWKAKWREDDTRVEVEFTDGIIKRLSDWRADYID